MRLVAGILLALLSAGALAASYAGQHAASANLEQLSLRRPWHALRTLFASPAWLVAYLGGWVAWGAYIGALALAPLSAVQAISAGGLGLLVLFARRAARGREWIGALIASVGTVLVIVSLRHGVSSHRSAVVALVLVIAGGLAASLLALVGLRGGRRAVGLAIAAGCSYGIGDVATKEALVGIVAFVPVFLVLHLGGFVATQLAYQRGSLLESAGLSSLLTNAIPLVAGATLFGEHPPGGGLGVLRLIGFAGALLGAALLAGGAGAPSAGAGDNAALTAEVPPGASPGAVGDSLR